MTSDELITTLNIDITTPLVKLFRAEIEAIKEDSRVTAEKLQRVNQQLQIAQLAAYEDLNAANLEIGRLSNKLSAAKIAH